MAQNSEAAPISDKRPVINSDALSASPSTQDQADRDSQLVRMFCLDLRPSYILDDGLLEFIAQVTSFGLPSEHKFSQELIPQEFIRAKSVLMKTLESVHHVAISIETWKWGTDKRDTDMFTATAHFVHQSKIVSQILFTLQLKQQAFPDIIGEAILKQLINWDVYKKVACIVSEGFMRHFDTLDAAEIFIPIRKPQVSCVATKLNFIIQRSLSHLNFDELEMKCQNDDSKSLIKKRTDEPFGWHDQFTVLRYISENNAGDFTEDERKSLCECFEVLKPFEDMNNKMSSQEYLPLSYFIPLLHGLQLRISECTPSTPQARKIKKKLQVDFLSSITDLELKATFMDPRFKATVIKPLKKPQELQQEVERELNECFSLYNQHNPVHYTSNNQSGGSRNLLDYLKDNYEIMGNVSFHAESVVSHYAQIPEIHPDEDPFQFWEDFYRISKCSQFYIMAQKYLCIPATAMPVPSISGECRWKKLTNRRKFVGYKNINETLFLHSYFRNSLRNKYSSNIN